MAPSNRQRNVRIWPEPHHAPPSTAARPSCQPSTGRLGRSAQAEVSTLPVFASDAECRFYLGARKGIHGDRTRRSLAALGDFIETPHRTSGNDTMPTTDLESRRR